MKWVQVDQSLPDFPWLTQTTAKRVRAKASRHRQCPFCKSREVSWSWESTTLIGGGDGTYDGDPNHRHGPGRCRACDKPFQRHAKSGNVWYTDSAGVVVLGLASCFETFNYPCKCGGVIKRDYRDADTGGPVTSLGYGKDGRTYFTFWKCNGSCGFEAQSKRDYWTAP